MSKKTGKVEKARKILNTTTALTKQGLLDAEEEEAVLIGTLPIIMDTRKQGQITDKQLKMFGKEINQTTNTFMKNARLNASEIPESVWDEALENEVFD